MNKESLEDILTNLSPIDAATRLIGCSLIRTFNQQEMIGRIVETEAYDESDSASHSFNGISKRNKVMFGPAAKAYVYFTYGMHYCVNVVVGPEGKGSAVLIRALEPIQGMMLMKRNRSIDDEFRLTNGPAKLCQALAIDKRFNGHDLARAPLRIQLNSPLKEQLLGYSQRIGINSSKANNLAWRVYLKDSLYLST